ncbi:MAG: signal peptidase I [Candidatus Aureabacteria bacterium]|nr:signal peptidase I [Candidatus Auribacterota bacterium]
MSKAKRRSPNIRKKGVVRENVEAIIWAVALALLIRTFVIEPYKIPTGSMKPTLLGVEYDDNGKKIHGGDKILANKFIYYFQKPQRGDIIIFRTKGIKGIDPKKKDFVKRLAGLPGETVEIKYGHLYVNGEKITEPQIFQEIRYEGNLGSADFGTTGNPVKIPENGYFVLGDNSSNSNDSRYWGFVPKKNVKGKALLIYWPPSRWRILK